MLAPGSVQLCATPETVAHQAPLSLRFPRQEHWSEVPFPSPMQESENWKVKSLSRVRLLLTPWTAAYQAPPSFGFPGKSTGVGCHFLLQCIFPTQGSNPGLLHCGKILNQLRHQIFFILFMAV